MHQKALKAKNLAINSGQAEEMGQVFYDLSINTQRTEFRSILKIAHQLHEDYTSILHTQTENWFFITARPNPECTWINFYNAVYKFTNRKCIQIYTLSFEQKGTSEETLGTGFHFHMVAKTTHRSKGECLRDTKSSFAKTCAENAIQVNPTRNPNDIIKKYLLEYESEDSHKACTKEWDALWRKKMDLDDLYSNDHNNNWNPLGEINDKPQNIHITTTITPTEEPASCSIKSEQSRIVSWD